MRPIKVRLSGRDLTVMTPADAAERVVDVIESGGLAVVPFDVSYAFLAGSLEPLKRIYELKLRPASRPCPILASWAHFLDLATEDSAEIHRIQRVIDAGLPVGVLTTPNWRSSIAKSIPRECFEYLVRDGKLALFMNMGGMGEALLTAADRRGIRVFGSSANISGRGNSFSLAEVPDSMLEDVDIVCDAGRCRYANPERLASTVVELETGALTRRGILHAEIERLLIDSEEKRGHDAVRTSNTQ